MLRKSVSYSLNSFIKNHNNLILYFDNSFGKEEYGNILSLYEKELSEHLDEVELDENEKHIYDMNLKKLSHDIYGTTDLWFTIAYFNNLKSPIEFTNFKFIKVLRQSGINLLSKYLKKLK